MTRQQLREKIDSELTDLTGGITSMELDLIMHLINEYADGLLIDELEKIPVAKLDTPHAHKSQKYRDAGKFISTVYIPKRIAELKNRRAGIEP